MHQFLPLASHPGTQQYQEEPGSTLLTSSLQIPVYFEDPQLQDSQQSSLLLRHCCLSCRIPKCLSFGLSWSSTKMIRLEISHKRRLCFLVPSKINSWGSAVAAWDVRWWIHPGRELILRNSPNKDGDIRKGKLPGMEVPF